MVDKQPLSNLAPHWPLRGSCLALQKLKLLFLFFININFT